jgi:hypothetical protein
MPKARKPIPIFGGGIFAGGAQPDPQHPPRGHAELLLLPGHRRVPHGRVREEQGADADLPQAQEADRREAGGEVPSKSAKPTRRGVSAGLRRIERQDLKENTLEVAKPAPAQP